MFCLAWTDRHRLIATTPAKSNTMPWEDVCRTCLDYTMTGLETLASLPRDGAGPLRFIYTSGSNAERDAGKKPWILGDYCVMRVSQHVKNANIY